MLKNEIGDDWNVAECRQWIHVRNFLKILFQYFYVLLSFFFVCKQTFVVYKNVLTIAISEHLEGRALSTTIVIL